MKHDDDLGNGLFGDSGAELNPSIDLSDTEKLEVPTIWKYEVRPSGHSKRYFYIVEIESDGFGETWTPITKPMTKNEMIELSNKIQDATF